MACIRSWCCLDFWQVASNGLLNVKQGGLIVDGGGVTVNAGGITAASGITVEGDATVTGDAVTPYPLLLFLRKTHGCWLSGSITSWSRWHCAHR